MDNPTDWRCSMGYGIRCKPQGSPVDCARDCTVSWDQDCLLLTNLRRRPNDKILYTACSNSRGTACLATRKWFTKRIRSRHVEPLSRNRWHFRNATCAATKGEATMLISASRESASILLTSETPLIDAPLQAFHDECIQLMLSPRYANLRRALAVFR